MRQVTDADHTLLAAGLQAWQDKSHLYAVVAKPDLVKGLSYVILNQHNAFIGHGFCLLVSEFIPWYGNARVLQEEFVLALPGQPSYNLRAVITFIKALAKERGVDYVMAGNSCPDKRLSALYRRAGFTQLADVFTLRT